MSTPLQEFPEQLFGFIYTQLKIAAKDGAQRAKRIRKRNYNNSAKYADKADHVENKASQCDAAISVLKAFRKEYNRLVREEKARLEIEHKIHR